LHSICVYGEQVAIRICSMTANPSV
jgi:hypothetical protein